MRADARRNRARVLAAADDVFAELGTAASTEEVARRAGVGIGTVFRHFATKEALLREVLVLRMRALADRAGELTGSEEPGAAFFEFLDLVVAQAGTKSAFAAAGADVDGVLAQVRGELMAAVELLLDRAQRAGAVRGDLDAADLVPLLILMAQAAEPGGAVPNRTMDVIKRGLRP
ncbi:TetR family transcriptional regulator [Allonocardiopsis opalescens]|uniref:TetR family transcriptional regulator n=2 Tax=Allonocardiopsis opalescens TaxID=1144618 RepID=A0A2T0QCB5_9ACTN|nr:TetR family transcriptional regulator [Allonocardiopsis opalescens]